MALVTLAYTFCLSIGHATDQRRAPIARKNHGHRTISISRRSLNILRQLSRPAADSTTPIAR